MTASKPETLLSFIYNATATPSYRSEMHNRMQTAFARFAVTDPTAQAGCFDVERAAYELRMTSQDVQGTKPKPGAANDHAAAVALMERSTIQLFGQVARELKGFLAQPSAVPALHEEIAPLEGTPQQAMGFGPICIENGQPRVRTDRRFTLLAYVHYFVHYPAVRALILQHLASLPATQQIGLPELQRIHTAASSADRDGAVEALCQALQKEYGDKSWVICW